MLKRKRHWIRKSHVICSADLDNVDLETSVVTPMWSRSVPFSHEVDVSKDLIVDLHIIDLLFYLYKYSNHLTSILTQFV